MKNILIVISLIISATACTSPHKKEIEEVDALLSIAIETEKALLSVDTAKVFAIKKIMKEDYKILNQFSDTLNKEEAFRIADIVGNKKKFFRLSSNYIDYVHQIELSKNQLINLKKDLQNETLQIDQFAGYFETEEAVLMKLTQKIHKSVDGIDKAIGKYELERPKLLEIFEKRKQKEINK